MKRGLYWNLSLSGLNTKICRNKRLLKLRLLPEFVKICYETDDSQVSHFPNLAVLIDFRY